MAGFDVGVLSSEIPGDNPCGQDLSYDPLFSALERAVQAGIVSSDSLGMDQPAEEPNWRNIRDESFQLLQQSKDLRIGVLLALSLLKLEGISGLSKGLGVLSGMITDNWEGLYPELDHDDGDDPFERINALQGLSPLSSSVLNQEPLMFSQRLMDIKLSNSAQMGRYSFRDIQVAKGAITISDDEKASSPEMPVIDASFQDTSTEDLQGIFRDSEEAIGYLDAIDKAFSEKSADSSSPNLSIFVSTLKKLRNCLQEYLATRPDADISSNADGIALDADGVASVVAATDGNDASPAQQGGFSLSGEIQTQEQALMLIDKVIYYFEKYEPSSPIPLLLKRANRLVSRNFMEIIEDFCPNALDQVRVISGFEDDVQ